MRAWLRDHWYVPLVAAASILAWLLMRSQRSVGLTSHVRTEVEAVQAAAQARRAEAAEGAAKARLQVEEKYAESLKNLSTEQALRAEELRSDPVELSRYLARVAGHSKRRITTRMRPK